VALHAGYGELRAEALDSGLGVFGLQHRVKLRGHFEELAVTGLPDFEKGTGVESAFNRSAAVELVFERLADGIFFETFAASVFQNAGEPEKLLPVQFLQGVLGGGHSGQ